MKFKGKIYAACIQSMLVYGSKTWALKVVIMQRLKRTERMIVRWMCGVTLKDRKSSQELLDRLNFVDISDRVRRGRLRWFGHMECKSVDDWMSRCREGSES